MSRGEGGAAAPQIHVAEDFLDHFRIVDEGNQPHLFLADRALQRVDMPRLADQVPSLPGREVAGRDSANEKLAGCAHSKLAISRWGDRAGAGVSFGSGPR